MHRYRRELPAGGVGRVAGGVHAGFVVLCRYAFTRTPRAASNAFVGDGINDAPALTQADVGVAIGAGTDIAIESADIVLTGDRLGAIADSLDIGRTSDRKTVQNLALAFALNGVGVPLAVTGLVQPVWAMIAMLASVTTVLANSFAGRYLSRRPGSEGTQPRELRRGTVRAKEPVATAARADLDHGVPVGDGVAGCGARSKPGAGESMASFGVGPAPPADRGMEDRGLETARLHSPAIFCSGCVATIRQELTELGGVDAVDGDPHSKWITVRYRPDVTRLEAIEGTIGYPVDQQTSAP